MYRTLRVSVHIVVVFFFYRVPTNFFSIVTNEERAHATKCGHFEKRHCSQHLISDPSTVFFLRVCTECSKMTISELFRRVLVLLLSVFSCYPTNNTLTAFQATNHMLVSGDMLSRYYCQRNKLEHFYEALR